MRSLALAGLVLGVLLVAVSGYIRLAKAGFGCAPWPECFGRDLAAAHGAAGSWSALTHRVTASLLGLVVLVIAWRAFFRETARSVRIAAVLLLALTLALAALGPLSASLALPAVTFTNLVGGVAIAALLGWLVVAHGSPPEPGTSLGRAVQIGLALAGTQLVLGGLAAAHLAGPACPDLFTCQGAWLPGMDRLGWGPLWQPLESGGPFPLAPALDPLHRLTGIAVTAYGLALAVPVAAWRRREGVVLLLLFLIPPALGIAQVLAGFPLALALLHYLATLALVLGLVRLGGGFNFSEIGPGKAYGG